MARVSDGELYYEDDGAGTPAVLMHAGLLDHRMWDEQVEVLVGAGYRTIRYDARGHGRSSTPQGEFAHYEDLRELLAHLEIPRANLVGRRDAFDPLLLEFLAG